MNKTQFHAYTSHYSTQEREIITQVGISKAYEGDSKGIQKFNVLWDTGATISAITMNVVNELQLRRTDVIRVQYGRGEANSNVYLVDIVLPNTYIFTKIRATVMDFSNDPSDPIDAIIGMDIISQGDFAVTHAKGRTTMSFMIPSHEEIDFIPIANAINVQKTGN